MVAKEKFDVNEQLALLLDAVAIAAAESGQSDALSLLATDKEVQERFSEFRTAMKEAGSIDMALIEFGPVKGENLKTIDDPANRGNWPVWKQVV